jgi:hypothetical protein
MRRATQVTRANLLREGVQGDAARLGLSDRALISSKGARSVRKQMSGSDASTRGSSDAESECDKSSLTGAERQSLNGPSFEKASPAYRATKKTMRAMSERWSARNRTRGLGCQSRCFRKLLR